MFLRGAKGASTLKFLKYEIISFSLRRCHKSKMVRVLNVAEKNDAAKNIANIMSNGNARRRDGRSVYNKIYEYDYHVFNQRCRMIMTSVSGHLLNYEFTGSYKSWQSCNPVSLFDAPVVLECMSDFQNIKKTLELEARNSQYLIIWTDGDREGENIGFEIIEVCKKVQPSLKVFRARFSEITPQAISRACANLVQPDKRLSDAVNVRRELDLRIGAAFTRFQTLRLKKVFPTILGDKLVSYGSCQFPTLGFVVERYKQIQAFIPEPFWKIKVSHKKEDVLTDFSWKRGRLFDHTACLVLYQMCLEEPTAKVINIKSRNKSKWRPQPLDTVEFEKLASRKLRINAKEAMGIAERLYTKGFISYPRTETTIFPKELDLNSLVEKQCIDPAWGAFANRVLADGPNPRQGTKTDNAHPPIHPTQYPTDLQGNDKRVYELVVRHFLACVSKDAEGRETTIEIEVNKERFAANGLVIIAKNYLDVYIYERWNAKVIGQYETSEEFQPSAIEMNESETSAPELLTEADLIGLMEKHGIGTDATHAEHIETIKLRLYVGLNENNRFVPGELGMGLVEGYDLMGFHMSKPYLRAELEADLKRITEGTKNPQVVLREQVSKYKECFIEVLRQAAKLDSALATYLEAAPAEVLAEEIMLPDIVSVMKCPKCQSGDIVLKSKRDGTGFFLSCMSFPSCNASIWLPQSVEDLSVLSEECEKCQPQSVKKLKFKVKQGSLRPFFPDSFISCLGGCDSELMEVLNLRPITATSDSRSTLSTHSLRNDSIDSGYESNQTTITNASNNFATSRSFPVSNTRSNVHQNTRTPSHQPHGQNGRQNLNDLDIVCNCGKQAIILTVRREGPNTGRQFYKCPELNEEARCNFFLWKDDETSGTNLQTSHNSPSPSNPHNTRQSNASSSNFPAIIRSSNDEITPMRRRPEDAVLQNSNELDIVCNCGKQAIVLTVRKEGPNTGRQFYKCPEPNEEARCNFFLWKDDETSGANLQTSHNSPFSSNSHNTRQSNVSSFVLPTVNRNSSDGSTPMCRCSEVAVLRTVVKEGPNKGKKFYSCNKPREESCQFFQWAEMDGLNTNSMDPPTSTSFAGPSTSNARRKHSGNSNGPPSKRKCGICSQTGHNRKNCPSNR